MEKSIQFIKDVFGLIKQAKTIQDLENIPDSVFIKNKNKMDSITYPKIEFNIQKQEIQTLVEEGILNKDLGFSVGLSSKLSDPLVKLLYATAWKNGDLKKIKHIIKGVLETEMEHTDQNDALVFYQFGKYLTKSVGQPIIDQHVIRAYSMYKTCENMEDVSKSRSIRTLNKSHKAVIAEYKKWLISNELTNEIKSVNEYTYHIDKILFAAGKTVKVGKEVKA